MSRLLAIERYELRIVIFFCTIAILIVFVGCQFVSENESHLPAPVVTELRSPANVLVSRYYHSFRPKRIVIVVNEHGSHAREQKDFAHFLANSLIATGCVDAVVASSTDCNLKHIRQGRFDLQQLVDLSWEYSADAVMYCDLADYSPYPALRASVSLTVVDAHESVALLAMNGVWDLRENSTRFNFTSFLAQGANDGFHLRAMENSPTEFLNYVASDIGNCIAHQ